MPGQHGGKRPGAGRKRGSLTRKTTEIAQRAADEGPLPLEVMLAVMRMHYQAERWADAVAVAKDAAPYVHPRLSAVQVEKVDDHDLDREIDERLALLAARRQEAPAGAPPPADGEVAV